MESIGGRVWPNVNFSDRRYDYAFSVWGNSTLGLLSYWWHSSPSTIEQGKYDYPFLGLLSRCWTSALSRTSNLPPLRQIFNEFRDKELKPAYLADADPNRALLDRRVVCDLLGFDEDVYEGVRRLLTEVVRGAVGAWWQEASA